MGRTGREAGDVAIALLKELVQFVPYAKRKGMQRAVYKNRFTRYKRLAKWLKNPPTPNERVRKFASAIASARLLYRATTGFRGPMLSHIILASGCPCPARHVQSLGSRSGQLYRPDREVSGTQPPAARRTRKRRHRPLPAVLDLII